MRTSDSPVALVVGPRHRDLEGFTVNRVWPTARRRLIGPFVFFDHMQPADLPPGRGLDIPPHPHIGLATVTYLFSGEIVHRDSLGSVQLIGPGDLNWMTAGSGIVHSERSSARARAADTRLHAIQSWVALPRAHEGSDPSFEHYPSEVIPRSLVDGVQIAVIAGSAFGMRSPAATLSDLFYVEARMPQHSELELDAALGDRAAYVVAGEIEIGEQRYGAGKLVVLDTSSPVTLRAKAASWLMLLGGAPLAEERWIWWNFVASSQALIESAKRKWAAGEFPRVPGDDGIMPLPR